MQIPLDKFVEKNKQEPAAKLLGISQSGLSKVLKANRNIIVICKDDGSYQGMEMKPFPSKKFKGIKKQ